MGFDNNLTTRELEICGLIAKGMDNESIGKFLFLSDGTVRNYIASIYEKTGYRNRTQVALKYLEEFSDAKTEIDDMDDISVFSNKTSEARLRYTGVSGLPEIIPIRFSDAQFIIGRFDISIGRKVCDFEFEKTTKAVSRRHASIERTAAGYKLVDLNSSAGTFVNGNRITPGAACLLQPGDRVSFGNAGADYVLEN
jgi:DNA-binding CsgD family transcriptional regulator